MTTLAGRLLKGWKNGKETMALWRINWTSSMGGMERAKKRCDV